MPHYVATTLLTAAPAIAPEAPTFTPTEVVRSLTVSAKITESRCPSTAQGLTAVNGEVDGTKVGGRRVAFRSQMPKVRLSGPVPCRMAAFTEGSVVVIAGRTTGAVITTAMGVPFGAVAGR